MLISKRRLRWTAMAMLIVCLLLFLRPTRSWLERVMIAQALGTKLTLSELVVHADRSIVEVRDLAWSASDWTKADGASKRAKGQGFDASVRRCWLAFDRHSLSQGLVCFPRVILQDANLSLHRDLEGPSARSEPWQLQMARHADLYYPRLRQSETNCLVACEKSRNTVKNGITRSVVRSQQIVSEATLVEKEAEDMDNPLRYAEAIQLKLSRFELLEDEQSGLILQLQQTKELVASETVRLQQLHDSDLFTLQENFQQVKRQLMQESQQQELSRNLALFLGECVWEQLSPYGEIVDQLSWTAANLGKSDYDLTVRNTKSGKELLQCVAMKGNGEYQAGALKTHFQTRGTWQVGQVSPGVAFRQLDFLTSFESQATRYDLACQHDSRHEVGIRLQIALSDALSQTDDRQPLFSAPMESEVQKRSKCAQLVCEAGELTGELSVDRATLLLLPCDLPEGLLDNPSEVDEPLKFEVRGVWKRPQLMITSSIPAWLQEAIKKLTARYAQQTFAQAQLKLDSEFNRQLTQLQQLLKSSLPEAETRTAGDKSTLAAGKARVQQRLDDIDGSEFARRKDSLQR